MHGPGLFPYKDCIGLVLGLLQGHCLAFAKVDGLLLGMVIINFHLTRPNQLGVCNKILLRVGKLVVVFVFFGVFGWALKITACVIIYLWGGGILEIMCTCSSFLSRVMSLCVCVLVSCLCCMIISI